MWPRNGTWSKSGSDWLSVTGGGKACQTYLMAIDNCEKSFLQLAKQTLPGHMKRLRAEMRAAMPLDGFCRRGVGAKTVLRRLGRGEDFPGCYALVRKDKPFYIGISRRVVHRLLEHVKGKTHYSASLAYMMASRRYPPKVTRSLAMRNHTFKRHFEKARRELSRARVAFVEILNPLELDLFEAYAAMELDTSAWNTFRTH